MFKKILIVLLILMCTSCASKKEEKIEYIQPVNDISIMSLINESLSKRLFDINARELENYQFKMLYKSVYENDLYDINDRVVRLSLYDNLLLQVLSIKCEHCHMLLEKMDEFEKDGFEWVIYFDNGTAEEIMDMFKELEMDVPEGVTIIPKDEGLSSYVRKTLDLQIYPSSVFYKNGELSFCFGGTFVPQRFEILKEAAFINTVDKEEFINEDGINVIDLARGTRDVENELSEHNREVLDSFSSKTKNMSLSLLGKTVDYDNIHEVNGDIYLKEVEDYSVYKDKKLVLFYLDVKSEEDIAFINNLIKENDGYEYLAVIDDSFEENSEKYLSMEEKLECKTLSSLASMPEEFMDKVIGYYPSALFIDNGIITGALMEISDLSEYKKATELFMESSIAVKY